MTKSTKFSLICSALAASIAAVMLVWEHFNGGVKTHHILQSAVMPGISNWWNLLLLPALTWFLSGRISRRMAQSGGSEKFPPNLVEGFISALIFGGLLSLFFRLGYEDITAILFFGMLLTTLVLPLYRAEYLLGFVLSMTLVFGAFIPIMIGSIVAAAAAIIQRVIYPLLGRAWKRSTTK